MENCMSLVQWFYFILVFVYWYTFITTHPAIREPRDAGRLTHLHVSRLLRKSLTGLQIVIFSKTSVKRICDSLFTLFLVYHYFKTCNLFKSKISV